MEIMQDKYMLGESSEKEILNLSQEIELNLKLNLNTHEPSGGQVIGIVTDSLGNPIENALIRLKTIYVENVIQALTNSQGEYVLNNIPANTSYSLVISANKMRLLESSQFSVVSYQTIKRNFVLEQDPFAELSIIAGDVFDFGSKEPLIDCVVLLFEIQEDDSRILKSEVHTNQYGQFVFREVPKGNYFLLFSIFGYITLFNNITITQPGAIIPMNVNMVLEGNALENVISGVISNSSNEPVIGATVLLYKKVNNNLIFVDNTTTNEDGVYIFTNLEKGVYEITSNQITLATTSIK